MTFFVLTLAGNSLENIIESSFYLSYYAHIQPSEIDKLSTYEFNEYMKLLNEQVKDDREFDMKLSGLSRMSNLMSI